MTWPGTGPVRRAIYTRKRSDEGLKLAFSSLHAQRELCEAYVNSQSGEEWLVDRERDDDGGHSGGNPERPALRRLRSDVSAGKVDVVVVYKVDRLVARVEIHAAAFHVLVRPRALAAVTGVEKLRSRLAPGDRVVVDPTRSGHTHPIEIEQQPVRRQIAPGAAHRVVARSP